LERREFESALDLYYDMMGWDRQTGVPTRGKLAELGLGWASQLLGQE
jgi:aldehyde:ferredoxin oxidoreductase